MSAFQYHLDELYLHNTVATRTCARFAPLPMDFIDCTYIPSFSTPTLCREALEPFSGGTREFLASRECSWFRRNGYRASRLRFLFCRIDTTRKLREVLVRRVNFYAPQAQITPTMFYGVFTPWWHAGTPHAVTRGVLFTIDTQLVDFLERRQRTPRVMAGGALARHPGMDILY
ncbi:hypothetical protein Y032_0108g62 [Ancylostoma ceylanicum]|uniref:Uncharacterized protein n=1 Tax=Ancylostoma ceylanicum TaxID=53326 RepID=A0A016TEF0_9BILA|nr:hypothetical protein Y032_0108g62 [Ancylostoma ceylanicum]